MKKSTLSFIALILFSANALAQQEVKFGPKVGVNFANFNGKDATNYKSLIGFHIGGFAEIKFNEHFAIQPEILYSTLGAKQEISWAELTSKKDYLNIPVLAKYYITPKFSIEAGPYVSFLLASTTDGTMQNVAVKNDDKEYSNTIDFGLGFGTSFNLDNGFFVGARYNLGLNKIDKDGDRIINGVKTNYEALDIKNSVIQIGVGYKF